MTSSRKSLAWLPILILALGLAGAFLGFSWTKRSQEQGIRGDLARVAGTRSAVVEQRLQSALAIPETVSRFFENSSFVSAGEFGSYAKPFMERLPEMVSLFWVDFPDSAAGSTPITYSARQDSEDPDGPIALGQIPGLSELAQEAMDRNKTTWVNLRPGPAAEAKEVWWIAVPVRGAAVRPGEGATESSAERGVQRGVVIAQVDVRRLLHSVFDNLEKIGLDVQIYDGPTTKGLPLCLWYSATRTSPYDPEKEQEAQAYIYRKAITLEQSQWWISSRPAPAFLARYNRAIPWTVAGSIVAFSSLLALYVLKVRKDEAILTHQQGKLQLLQDVAVSSNLAKGTPELLQSCMELIGKYLSWPFGHVYLWDEEAKMLVSSGMFFQKEAGNYDALRAETAQLRFAKGEGMPGRVVSSHEAVFLPDVERFDDFRRLSSARATGVRSCFAFPVVVRGEVSAVVEFFSVEKSRLLDGWEALLRSISIQMAHAMERTLASEELREKTAMMENAAEGIAQVDERGVYLSVNKAYATMCGMAAASLIGLNRRLMIHPDDADLFTAAHLDMVMEGRSHASGRHVRPDGVVFYEEVTMVRDLDRQGKLRGAYLFSRDVTEREKQQAALRDSEDRFAAFMEHNPATASIKDEESRLLYVNKRAELHFGKDQSDFLGRTPEEITHPEAAEEIRSSDQQVLETNEAVTLFEALPNKNGEIQHWLVCKFPMRDQKGRRLIGSLGLDVTERRLAEQAIIQARDAALESADLKSKFLANMSHEIRTPMNGLTGMLSLLSRTNLEPDQEELLKTAVGASESLLRLLNDILDFSKIEAGKLEIDPTVFNPRQCLRHAVQIGRELARQKGIALEERVADNVPTHLYGDAGRLSQIWINLLNNALKFTHEGSVSVSFQVDKEISDRLLLLHCVVRDTGIGITEAQRQSIFDPFQQADSSTARKYGGTGLGLAICAQLVGLMGGRIWVESEPSGGTAIHFTAQMEEADPPLAGRLEPLEPDRVALRPLQILLVEDNRLNQRIATTLLEERGHRVTLAEDGNEAVAVSARERFDLILMDLQMPIKDGYEATAEIRERGDDIPIFAVTAHAMPEDRRRCLAAGMNGYLTKPIQVKEFARVVEGMAERSSPQPEPVEPAVELPETGPAKISPTRAFDREIFLENVGQDEDFARELAEIFREQAFEDLESIRQAIATKDAGLLERSAHRLKGSALGIAASPLAKSTQIMETAGRYSDLGTAEGEWSHFEGAFMCLVEELQAFRNGKFVE